MSLWRKVCMSLFPFLYIWLSEKRALALGLKVDHLRTFKLETSREIQSFIFLELVVYVPGWWHNSSPQRRFYFIYNLEQSSLSFIHLSPSPLSSKKRRQMCPTILILSLLSCGANLTTSAVCARKSGQTEETDAKKWSDPWCRAPVYMCMCITARPTNGKSSVSRTLFHHVLASRCFLVCCARLFCLECVW